MKTIVSKLRPVRRAQGGAWSKIGDQPLSADLLRRMGQALVRAFADEASRAFAMRGWSMKSMDGGKPINRSFSFRIVGDSTVEVLSSFPGLPELVQGIAPRANKSKTWERSSPASAARPRPAVSSNTSCSGCEHGRSTTSRECP